MSGLRCRPGDLAVVVGATMTPGLDGMFVIVERRSVDGEVVCGLQMSTLGFPSWVCRSAVTGALLPAATSTGRIDRVLQRHIADCILRPIRPIRPNDGEDETLSWARPRVGEVA